MWRVSPWITLLLACGTAPAPLQLERVSPATMTGSAATALVIHGQGFTPLVSVDLDSQDRTAINAAFSATMHNATDSFALSDVSFTSTTALRGTAPSALAPGTYSLQLTAPDGSVASLANALEVTP